MSIEASCILFASKFYLDAPEVQRVAIEHSLRLIYIHNTPEEEIPQSIYKFFGNGPRPTELARKENLS
jgi:hypothetical protein